MTVSLEPATLCTPEGAEIDLEPTAVAKELPELVREPPGAPRLRFPSFPSFGRSDKQKRAREIVEKIRQVRVELAEYADTTFLTSDAEHDCLKSQLGMNVIVPQGRLDALRLMVELRGSNGSNATEVYAVDGAPSNKIDVKHLVEGRVTIAITKALELVGVVVGGAVGGPVGGVLGQTAAGLLDVELNPFEFSLGNIRNVEVAFSGGLTSRPEWYFRGPDVSNAVGVVLTIKKARAVRKIDAKVTARWTYNPPDPWRRVEAKSDFRTIKIYQSP